MAYLWYAMPADLAAVKSLIHSGNNPNQVNLVGDSVLHCAACNTSITNQIFQFLIDAGADVNTVGHKNQNVLQLNFSRCQDPEKAMFFINAGFNTHLVGSE